MFENKLVTVWSAPNYCYRCGNIASILEFKSVDERNTVLFKAVPDSERVIPSVTVTPYFLWSNIALHLFWCREGASGSRLYGCTWLLFLDRFQSGWYNDSVNITNSLREREKERNIMTNGLKLEKEKDECADESESEKTDKLNFSRTGDSINLSESDGKIPANSHLSRDRAFQWISNFFKYFRWTAGLKYYLTTCHPYAENQLKLSTWILSKKNTSMDRRLAHFFFKNFTELFQAHEGWLFVANKEQSWEV